MNASITDRFIFNIGNIIGKIKLNPEGCPAGPQMTEGRRQITEDGRQRSELRMRNAECGNQGPAARNQLPETSRQRPGTRGQQPETSSKIFL